MGRLGAGGGRGRTSCEVLLYSSLTSLGSTPAKWAKMLAYKAVIWLALNSYNKVANVSLGVQHNWFLIIIFYCPLHNQHLDCGFYILVDTCCKKEFLKSTNI